MNKGLDAYSFLFFPSVKRVILPPKESRAVKTSLVMTHYVFIIFLSLFREFSFAEHVCRLSVRIAEFGGCRPLHCCREILLTT